MNEKKIPIIKYRLERAHESLKEAELLLSHSHINTYVNRLYYACFYAVSALLLTKDLSSAKHAGIRSLFHQHFIKTGQIDKKLGLHYDKLFDNRQKSDYADLVIFNLDEVKDWITETQIFVKKIEEYIN